MLLHRRGARFSRYVGFPRRIDRVMDGAERRSGIFNVSSGEGHSIKEVYDAVAKPSLVWALIPACRCVPVGDDDVAELVPDPSKTIEALGWKPTSRFQDDNRRDAALV